MCQEMMDVKYEKNKEKYDKWKRFQLGLRNALYKTTKLFKSSYY